MGQLQKLSPGCLGVTVYQEVRGLNEGNVLESGQKLVMQTTVTFVQGALQV